MASGFFVCTAKLTIEFAKLESSQVGIGIRCKPEEFGNQ